jgi:hypothetical protein
MLDLFPGQIPGWILPVLFKTTAKVLALCRRDRNQIGIGTKTLPELLGNAKALLGSQLEGIRKHGFGVHTNTIATNSP